MNPETALAEDIPIFAFEDNVPKLTIDNVTSDLASTGDWYNNLLNLSEDINPVRIPDLTLLATSIVDLPLNIKLVLN